MSGEPLPGTRAPDLPAEPAADEESGGWWSWLTTHLSRFFGSLGTTDPGVETSAGPRPYVDLTGDADPGQAVTAQGAGATTVGDSRVEADTATGAPRGEAGIAPTPRPPHQLSATITTTPTAGRSPAALPAPVVPPDLLQAMDTGGAELLGAQTSQHAETYAVQHIQFTQSTEEAYRAGEARIAADSAATTRDQLAMRDQARAEVGAERERWQEENVQIQGRFATSTTARRDEVHGQIQLKVRATQSEAADKLTAAEAKAEAEKRSAEAEAARKKAEEEKKPRSFWDRVKGAVSSVFDAIRSVVKGIFDKLRSVVRGIIEAAKSAAHAVIEAARSVVTGLIRGFGEFVKGLVSIALAAFPEAAERARAWIDDRVDAATAAVDHAAEALEQAVDTVLDGIGAAVEAALGVLEGAWLLALDAVEFLAKGPFELMELLERFGRWLVENSGLLDVVRKVTDDPDSIIEALKGALEAQVLMAPRMADAALTALESQLPQPAQRHVQGVHGYLDKGMSHLRDHWWDELKKLGWTLLWPWPTVGTHIVSMWAGIKDLWEAAKGLQLSRAIDDHLKIVQDLNGIAGAVYGWFFIASVLIGAAFGAGVPGALAGAAFAGEVGQALVLALVATEAAVITKSVVDLARGANTQTEDETDYEHIAGSTLTIAVTGAMMILGEIAGQLGKAIWNGVKGLFKGGADASGAVVDAAAAGTREAAAADTAAADTATRRAAEPVAEEGGGCFVAGTEIATPSGPRAIESLLIGDEVVADDAGTVVTVARLWSRVALRTLRLGVDGIEIQCSPEHPFASGDGWVIAADLDAGSQLHTLGGDDVSVQSVRTGPTATVFNLTVTAPHTYHVSARAVLVHNKAEQARVEAPELVEARSAAENQLIDLEAQARATRARAEALPEDAPGRTEAIEGAEFLEEHFADLHDRVVDAADPAGVRSFQAETEGAMAELQSVERVVDGVSESPVAEARAGQTAEEGGGGSSSGRQIREEISTLSENDLDKLLARVTRGDAKGRAFGSPRNPRMPTIEEFNPRIESIKAGELEASMTPKHGQFPDQVASVKTLSNEELIRFRMEDPISATPGTDGLQQTGGHHRTVEIGRRVASGDLPSDTLVRVLLHD